MLFLRWTMFSHKGRIGIVAFIALVLLILHIMNLFPATASSRGPRPPMVEFIEHRWVTPLGTFLCLTPVASSKIMRASLVIPGAPECILLESVATE